MRPEGWKNPYDEKMTYDDILIDPYHFATFEAGADAYERCLKKEGIPISSLGCWDDMECHEVCIYPNYCDKLDIRKKGYLVFIEEG